MRRLICLKNSHYHRDTLYIAYVYISSPISEFLLFFVPVLYQLLRTQVESVTIDLLFIFLSFIQLFFTKVFTESFSRTTCDAKRMALLEQNITMTGKLH